MAKPLSKAECLAAAEAVFQARVIVERYLQLPQGKLDERLRELELDYYRHADAAALKKKESKRG